MCDGIKRIDLNWPLFTWPNSFLAKILRCPQKIHNKPAIFDDPGLIGAKHLGKGLLQQWHVHLAVREVGKEDFLPRFILLSRDAGKVVIHLG